MIDSDSAPVAKKRNENVTLSGPPPESVTDVGVQPALTPEAFLASVAAERERLEAMIAADHEAIANARATRHAAVALAKADYNAKVDDCRSSTRAHRARLAELALMGVRKKRTRKAKAE